MLLLSTPTNDTYIRYKQTYAIPGHTSGFDIVQTKAHTADHRRNDM